MSEVVQYIIIRKDLKLSFGKFGAQVGHAVMQSVLPYMDDIHVKQWFANDYPKILLGIDSLEKLLNIKKKLTNAEISYTMITDNCRTELKPETADGTITCLGLKPVPKSLVEPILKRLRLY